MVFMVLTVKLRTGVKLCVIVVNLVGLVDQGMPKNFKAFLREKRTLYIGIGYILPTIGRYVSVGLCLLCLCALRA